LTTDATVEQVWRWVKVMGVLVAAINVAAIVVVLTLSAYPWIALVNVVGLVVLGTGFNIARRIRKNHLVRRQSHTS
jgi:hypothetical protein